MNCLIAGATGLVGAQALKLLLASPQVHQVVMVTRKSTVPNPKLKQIVMSFESLEGEQLPSCDVALCALGTTIKVAGSQEGFRKVDHDYVLSFARAAKRAGVRKFVLVSALGADANSRVFYNRIKGETERDVKAVGFESVIILQPSLLLGERKQKRPLERAAVLLEPIYSKLLFGRLKAYQPIRASQVAQVMVSLALDHKSRSQTILNVQLSKPVG